MAAKSGSRKKSGGTRSGDAAAKDQTVAELKDRIAVLENELRLRNDSSFSGTVRGGQPGAAPGEGEEKFRAIFDRAALGLAISDPTGLIIDCNSAYVEMLGYGKEELRKMRYLDFTHPDDVSKNRDFQRRMNDGLIDRYQFEKRYMRKDGSVIWCNVVASAIRSPDGSLKFNMAVIEDITRRRQAEERAAYLASYPELNPNPVFEVGVDGNVGYANPSTEKVFPGLMAMGTTHPILEGFSEIVDGFKPGKSSFVRDVEFHGAFYQQAINFVPDRKVVRFYNVDITGRKQAEEALRASEEKFRQMAENIGEVLFTFSPDWKRTVYVSPAYERVWGRPLEDVYRDPMDWLEGAHPEDRGLPLAVVHRNVGGDVSGNDRVEFRLVRPDGSVRWIYARTFPIRDEHGRLSGITGIAEDITERKRAEEALAGNLAVLAKSQEIARLGSWSLDFETGTYEVSDEIYRIYGFEPGAVEPLQELVLKLIHPDDLERFTEYVESVQRDGYLGGIDYRVVWPDGSVHYLHVQTDRVVRGGDGRVKMASGVTQDITERKRAEQALANSHRMLQLVIDNIPQAIFWKDTNSVYLGCNKVLARDVGLKSTEDIVGKTDYDLSTTREQTESYRAYDRMVMDRDEPVRHIIEKQRRADGTTAWLDTNKVPLHGESGEVVGILCTYEDITERRRAEEELRESKERFQALADNIPNLAWMANADGWIFWYNKQWYDYTGTTPEEMRGWGWQKVHHPDYVKAVTEEWSTRIEEGKPYDNIFPLRGKDGNYRWFLTRVTPIKDENGKIQRWFGTNTDITDRKRDEEEHRITADFLKIINKAGSTDELVRSAAKFLQEQSGCEVLGIRLKQGEDYPYYIARGFPAEFLEQENHLCARGEDGRTVYDRNGLPVYECVCGNVISGRANRSMPFYTARGSFWTNSTSELVEKYGEADLMAKIRGRCVERFESVAVIRVSLGGETLGLLHINDPGRGRFSPELIARWELLADQLAVALGKFRAEEALRESEANLARAQRITRLGNWSWDVKEDRVQGSAEFFRLFGFANRQSIVFGEFITRLHPEDREPVDGAVKAALSGSRPYSVDYRVVPPDGVERVIHAEGEVTRDNAGRPATMFGTVQDITERKKAEKELEEAKSRAELYVDLMGHDINNQNQSAQGFLELALQTLEMDGKIGPGGKVLIEKPLQAIENSSRLISNVRKLQKLADEGVKARPVDLHDLFGELEALDYRIGDRGAAIHIHEAPHCTVNGSDLLRDVFFNLISNAVKHARREGPVIVDVKAEPVHQEGRPYCRCTVEDNGPGVPDDLKPKLFHRFQRGKTKAHGKGLGLYLVRSLVESYEGKVWVEDRVKGDHTKGARFVVMLPAAEK